MASNEYEAMDLKALRCFWAVATWAFDLKIENYGGIFKNLNFSGYAYLGHEDLGIEAGGNFGGGLFNDSDSSGSAYIGLVGTVKLTNFC